MWSFNPVCVGRARLIENRLTCIHLDLNFKAKPPADYEYPAVNLVEAVTGIVDKLQNNSYANEYAWQADVFKTFMSARDGHL